MLTAAHLATVARPQIFMALTLEGTPTASCLQQSEGFSCTRYFIHVCFGQGVGQSWSVVRILAHMFFVMCLFLGSLGFNMVLETFLGFLNSGVIGWLDFIQVGMARFVWMDGISSVGCFLFEWVSVPRAERYLGPRGSVIDSL